jgi:hypothetical protein
MKTTSLRFLLPTGFFLLVSLITCNGYVDEPNGSDSDEETPNTETNENEGDDPLATNPKDTVFADAVTIAYAAEGVSVNNPYANKGVSVTVSGGRVTVESTFSETAINYVLTGAHTDGSFKIYSEAAFGITLNGVRLICSDGPAINIQSRQEASILPVNGTTNQLIDNNLYADDGEDRKATLFSEGSLLFRGDGKLILKGYCKHAICSDDDITVAGGDIEIQSAYKDGIHAKDRITVSGGVLSVTASDDGMECEEGDVEISGGEINIRTTGGDAYTYDKENSAKGIKAAGNLSVDGGAIRIATSTQGAEGLESKKILTINGGDIEVEAYDDAINASQIVINGGRIYAYSDSNDGIDSNGPLTISGGTVVSSGASSPEDGIDCDQNTLKVTGGVIIASGGASSTPTANVCTQASILYSASASAGQLIRIESAEGTEIATFTLPRSYNQMTLLVSDPDIVAGTGYSLYTGGSVRGGTEFHGLYSGSDYTAGTLAYSFTVNAMVTGVGNPSSGMGGGGGMGGGMGGGGRPRQ